MLVVANLQNLRKYRAMLFTELVTAADTARMQSLYAEIYGKTWDSVAGRTIWEDSRFNLLVRLCTSPLGGMPIWEKLEKINLVLGMYGLESMSVDSQGNYTNPRTAVLRVIYCNSGETYGTTILWWRNKLRIGDRGCLVEKYASKEPSR